VLQRRLHGLRPLDGEWLFRRMGYSEATNPAHMGMIMSTAKGKAIGVFQSKKIAPTPVEYLKALEAALFGGAGTPLSGGTHDVKPSRVAVDEKDAVARLQRVLTPAGITARFQPPPTEL